MSPLNKNIDLPQGKIIAQDFITSQLQGQALRIALINNRNLRIGEDYTSYLNTPVYGSFTLGDIDNLAANNYVDQFGETQSYAPVRFHECTFTIAQSKNIIVTPLQGFNGTVKEYVSDGDFEISINGRISGIWNQETKSFERSTYYPIEYLQNLLEVMRTPSHIPVYSDILNRYLNVNYVVVTNYSLPRNTHGANYQDFTLDLISDRQLEFVLTEDQLSNNDFLFGLLGI